MSQIVSRLLCSRTRPRSFPTEQRLIITSRGHLVPRAKCLALRQPLDGAVHQNKTGANLSVVDGVATISVLLSWVLMSSDVIGHNVRDRRRYQSYHNKSCSLSQFRRRTPAIGSQ